MTMYTTWRTLLVFAAFSCAAPAKAGGLPVYDASNTFQSVQQVANQLKQLKAMADDYANQIQQVNNLVKQTTAMTGTRNMGSLLNGTFETQMRRYLPTDLNGLLNLGSASGGSIAGAQNVWNRLHTDYDPLSGADLDPTYPTGPLALSIDRRTQTTYATLAASEEAYNQIQARTMMLEAMLAELDATTDIKASADLQARIAAENALIANERLRLQALQMQLDAATANEILVRQRQARKINTYDGARAAATIK